ncbi:tautomerase family protein [Sessilibacter corallicola]|uniref:4-oxalocrotonate tautomerase family protein n=1 Tax=Sessilibacter corallicola TaxID=2904075 RepID=A0ABQ0AAK5_9GAMM|nr:4-oxalocrotonate tautomerase family protein [Sessilibacter corallicola]MCE2029022.1 4-oxalocrotonate tautomerase family protein [Sessilibacter corallicola]
MPLITVKVFEDELDAQQSKDLIEKITSSVTEVTSEKLRDVTWVVIEEVKDGQWGVGGNALSLADVKKLMAE